jgi:hypothetical protein
MIVSSGINNLKILGNLQQKAASCVLYLHQFSIQQRRYLKMIDQETINPFVRPLVPLNQRLPLALGSAQSQLDILFMTLKIYLQSALSKCW